MSLDKQLRYLVWYKDPVQFYRDIYREEPMPYQAKVLKEICTLDRKIKRALIVSAGNSGKTKLLACIALWFGVVWSYFNSSQEINIISGSQKQSKNLYLFSKNAIMDTLEIKERVSGDPLISQTEFRDRSIIRALANSLKDTHGKHGDVCIIDESVLAGNAVIKDVMQRMLKDSNSIALFSGTPMNEMGGDLFIEMWEDGDLPKEKQKYPEWERYHWTAFEASFRKGIIKEAEKYGQEGFDIFVLGKPHPLLGFLIPSDKIKIAKEHNPIFKYNQDGERPKLGLDIGGYKNPAAAVVSQKIDNIDYILYCEEKKIKKDPSEILDWVEGLFNTFNCKVINSDSLPRAENDRLRAKGLPVNLIVMEKVRSKYQANMRRKFLEKLVKIPEDYVSLLQQLSKYDWDTSENDDLAVALMLSLIDEDKELESEEIQYSFKRIPKRTI